MAFTKTWGTPSLDAALARKAAGLKHVKAPTGVAFSMVVTFDDKVKKAVEKDTLLIREFDEAAEDTVSRFVDFVGLKMKATDELVDKLFLANKAAEIEAAKKKMNADIEAMRGSAQQFGVTQINKCWSELQRKNAEYTRYKIKIVVTIGSAVAGLATSIALMAASPWTGGASAALSIIGMVKAGVVIAKESAAAAMEIETAIQSTAGRLKAVQAIWSRSKVAGHAAEVTSSVIGQFLGEGGPSIKECQNWVYKCEQKLNGIVVNNHKLARQREDMKKGLSRLMEDFMKEADKRLAKRPDAKAQKARVQAQFFKAIEKAENDILEAARMIELQIQRAKKAEKQVSDLKKAIDALAANKGLSYKIIDNLLLLSDLAVSGLSGNNLVQTFNDMAGCFGAAAGSLSIDRVAKIALEGTALD